MGALGALRGYGELSGALVGYGVWGVAATVFAVGGVWGHGATGEQGSGVIPMASWDGTHRRH